MFEFSWSTTFLPERLAMKQIYLRYLVLAEALRKSSIDLSGIDDIGKNS